MAVRHGYGKIAGADALVFAYDTGDTVNSYKGEPVTNLWDTMLNTQSLRTHTKHFWDGRQWTVDATYTHPGVEGPRGVYLGLVFKHVSGALSNSWSGTSYGYMLRDIACTNGATMTMSSWIYASTDCNVDAIPAVIEQEAGGESTVAGYPAQYDLTNKGTWQVVAKKATSDGQVRFIPLYPRKNGVTDGSFTGFFMWALPQVTYGDHVVQPIQPGATRSATQGLLDLTGNSTIDLTNLDGYNSNAEIDFDGTNDRIEISHNSSVDVTGAEITLEQVLKKDTSSAFTTVHKDVQYSLRISGDQIQYADSSNWSYSSFGGHNMGVSNGDYFHLVAVKKDGVVTIYVNNSVVISKSFGGSVTSTSNKLFIGSYSGTSNYMNGQIPVTKIYNRALTAAEVKNNYNNYKGRFNL